MNCFMPLLPALLGPVVAPAPEIRGHYVEARTCDVYTGSCFANADTGLTGKNAVLGWKIDTDYLSGANLSGLGVVAVISAHETLGLKQDAPARAIILVDERATKAQREALLAFVKAQAGDLVGEIVAVRTSPIDLSICPCESNGCAMLNAGSVKVATRCLDVAHDKACGNETTLYPPLTRGVSARAAMALEHCFCGSGLDETWKDTERRGAFVGEFTCTSPR